MICVNALITYKDDF